MPSLYEELQKILDDQQAGQKGESLIPNTPAAGYGAPSRMRRAAEALSSIPTTNELTQQVQERVTPPTLPSTPGPAVGVYAPPQPGEGEFQPPSGPADEGSIPVLSGIGAAMDFISRVGSAPMFLGKKYDPNTGFVTIADPRPIDPNTGEPIFDISTSIQDAVGKVSDIFPQFGWLLDLATGRAVSRSLNLWRTDGINPFEQMAQTANFDTESQAVRMAQSKGGAQTATGIRAGIPAGIGILTSVMKHAIVNNLNFHKTIEETPGIVEGEVRTFRAELAKTAAGESEPLTDIVGELFNPSWVVVGGPLTKMSLWGVSLAGRLPIIRTASKGIAGQARDLYGSWWFTPIRKALEKTPEAKAQNALETIDDFIGGLQSTHTVDEGDVLGMIKHFDNFRNSPFENNVGTWFETMPVPKQSWELFQKYPDKIDEVLKPLRILTEEEPTIGSITGLKEHLAQAIRGAVLAEEKKKLGKPIGAIHNLRQGLYELATNVSDKFGAYWTPLTLATRVVYHANNLVSGLAMNLQREGAATFTNLADRQLAAQAGLLEVGAKEGLLGKRGGASLASSRYTREAFSGATTGGIRELPTLYQKIPVLNKILQGGQSWASDIENQLHVTTQVTEEFKQLRNFQKSYLASLPPEAQEILTDTLTSTQAAAKFEELLKGTLDPRNYVTYGNLPPDVATQLAAEVTRVTTKGTPATMEQIRQAYEKLRIRETQKFALKKAAAFKLDIGGGEVEDLLTARGIPDHPMNPHLASVYANVRQVMETGDDSVRALIEERLQRAAAKAQRSARETLAQTTQPVGKENIEYYRLYQRYLEKAEELHKKTTPTWTNKVWEETARADYIVKHPEEFTNAQWLEAQQFKDDKFRAYFDTRIPYAKQFGVWYDNIANITLDSMLRGRSLKQMEKLLSQWWNSGNSYPLTEEITTKIAGVKSRAVLGKITDDQMREAAIKAGFNPDDLPGTIKDYLAEVRTDWENLKTLIEASEKSFLGRVGAATQKVKKGQLGSMDSVTESLGGVSPSKILYDMRQNELKARDIGTSVAKQVQMDYMGDTRNIDRLLRIAFPFHFWQTRYMLFQIKNAVRDPNQALGIMRVVKSWMDANRDQPFWNRLSVHLATLDAGTPDEIEVRFNPANLIFPMGGVIGEVIKATDPERAKNFQTGLDLVGNFIGGSMYPYIPVLSSALGFKMAGGQPDNLGDMFKTLAPPITWARQGLTAFPGLQAATLGLLTEKERDQVIRAMQNDVNMGKIGPTQAKQAAMSILQNTPNELALEYLQKTNPERFLGSLIHAQIGPFSNQNLASKESTKAYAALREAKTQAEKQAVFENYPGLQVGLAGKRGDELQLALINAAAPVNQALRRSYYAQWGGTIDELSRRIDAKNGDDVAIYKLHSATPESFDAFRQAGGSQIVPNLVDYWMRGSPLKRGDQELLAKLYHSNGMGSLTFNDWRDRILFDAYMQWVMKNYKDLKSR